jgi:NAD(P)-dependent dehydrogenase (short-subunit alcohol dehydrogenase family)
MKDQQVLLTGGTGGLGLGVTPVVLSHGARLTITYRDESEVSRLKSRLSSAEFERIRFVKVDLTQEAAVARLIDDLGRVDVLIHLVGGFSMGSTVSLATKIG